MNRNFLVLGAVFAAGTGLGWLINSGFDSTPNQNQTVSEKRAESSNPKTSRYPRETGSSSIRGSLFPDSSVGRLEQLLRDTIESANALENNSYALVLTNELAKKDPLAAIALAREAAREDLVYAALQQIAENNPEDALRWIKENESNDSSVQYLTMAVYEGWARVDPVGAVRKLEQLPAGVQRDQILSNTVNEWAKKDITAAFNWLKDSEISQQSDNVYESTFSLVMEQYITKNLDAASAFVAEMASGQQKVSFASQIATKMAEQDTKKALEWVDKLEGADEKKYAFMGIMHSWAAGPNGAEALAYLAKNPNHPNHAVLFETVIANLSHKNPDALVSALPTMSDAQQIDTARQLASSFTTSNPEKLKTWLAQLGSGAVRDQAVMSSVNIIKDADAAEAFHLSTTISDQSLRAQKVEEVIEKWAGSNQEAASHAVSTTSALSPSQKKLMLDAIRNRQNSFDASASSR